MSMGLLAANNPAEALEQAAEIAKVLKGVITQQGLAVEISRREYVRVEGWTTLAAMLGVTPHELSNTESEDGYTAVVAMARCIDGREISRASAECRFDEDNWRDAPAYAVRSMAATRATSKACRLAFSWIMVLAGYEATPAEEMSGVKPRRKRAEKVLEAGVTPTCPRCGDRELFKFKTGANWFCKESGGGCGDEFTPKELGLEAG
jgi:hypothetical protein